MDLHRETWKGHRIVIPREPQQTVVIDAVPYRNLAGDCPPSQRVLDATRESPKRGGYWVAVRP